MLNEGKTREQLLSDYSFKKMTLGRPPLQTSFHSQGSDLKSKT